MFPCNFKMFSGAFLWFPIFFYGSWCFPVFTGSHNGDRVEVFVLDIVLENGKDIPCTQNVERSYAKFDENPAEKISERFDQQTMRFDRGDTIFPTASIQHSHSIEVNGGPMEKAFFSFFPFNKRKNQHSHTQPLPFNIKTTHL